MGGVFVSYRRQDSQGSTGRLADRLDQLVGDDVPVFVDIDSIRPGQDFRRVISDTLSKCNVTLVVIGPRWLDATDDRGQRRLDDPTDLHRLEVESALESDATTIPVLVEGATMPSAEELPASISQLAYLHAAEVSVRRFAADAEYLADMIAAEIDQRGSSSRMPPPPPAPPAPQPSPADHTPDAAFAEAGAEEAPDAAVNPEPITATTAARSSDVRPESQARTGPDRRILVGLGVLLAVVVAVGAVVALTGDDDTPQAVISDDKDDTTATEVAQTTQTADVDVLSLDVGQCFDASEASTGTQVRPVDCTAPHLFEVFAVWSSFSGTAPDDRILQEGCISRFRDAVGIEYPASDYYSEALWPSDELWEAGDRDIVCVGYTVNADRTIITTTIGSMLGSNR